MCHFDGFIGTNIADHVMQLYLYLVGCLVFKTNFLVAITTLGLLPIYIFFILYFLKKWEIKNKKFILSICIALSLLLSTSSFIMAIIIGQWG